MTKPSLKGERLILMISDPWDFGTELGNGPFECEVVQEREKFLLVRLLKPWVYQGVTWEYLVAQSGHADKQLSSLIDGSKMLASVIRTSIEQINTDTETFGSKSYRGQYSMLTGSLQLTSIPRGVIDTIKGNHIEST